MLIITSAAYIPSELVSELGNIPPSFLPLANTRLYRHQLDAVAGLGEPVVLTLPDDFTPDAIDIDALTAAQVRVVRTPASLRLVESLRAVLAEHGIKPGEPVRILHGDTLQDELPLRRLDVVSVARNDGYYQRAFVALAGTRFAFAEYRYCIPGEPVFTGYFAFADGAALAEVLAESADWISAINRYHERSAAGLSVFTTERWADCGHVNAYYQTRARRTTERAFNALRAERYYIRKGGQKPHKIRAEIEWFRRLPAAMRHYTPQLGEYSVDPEETYYDIEYLCSLPLSDLYVFGRLPVEEWGAIFMRCVEFLSECRSYPAPSAERGGWESLYLPKTRERLEAFCRDCGWDADAPTVINGRSLPSLHAMALAAQRVLDAAPAAAITLCHGDFCFSNVLYDPRSRRIKVIDPRGLGPGERLTSFGDLRYDLGKLFHSVEGGYDFAIARVIHGELAGRNSIRVHGSLPEHTIPVRERFRRECLAPLASVADERLVAAITVHLFLSMLPLHADDRARQLALMSRAAALFERFQLD